MFKMKYTSLFIFLVIQILTQFVAAKTLVFSSPKGGDFKIGKAPMPVINTKDFRGSQIILLFGFTQCKSVCPFSLRNIKNTIDKLKPEDQKNIKVVFISVDNERDQNLQIQDFLKPYGPNFIGATGSDRELKKVLAQYGARYYRYKTESKKILVDHTSDIFIVNQKGIWTQTLGFDATPDQIASSLTKSDSLLAHENSYPESRKVDLAQPPKCDLNKKPCDFKIQNEQFSIELEKTEVRPQYENKFIIKSKNIQGQKLIPVEVDLEGIDLSMGFNRPAVTPKTDHYESEFTLPICELKKMNWKATVIFKDPKNNYSAVQYVIQSEDK